jgi:hypothetical protein
MTTPHVIASSTGHPSHSTSSNGIIGGNYRVGKKIGEGSFGVVFEGMSPQIFYLEPVPYMAMPALCFCSSFFVENDMSGFRSVSPPFRVRYLILESLPKVPKFLQINLSPSNL